MAVQPSAGGEWAYAAAMHGRRAGLAASQENPPRKITVRCLRHKNSILQTLEGTQYESKHVQSRRNAQIHLTKVFVVSNVSHAISLKRQNMRLNKHSGFCYYRDQ